MKQRKAYDFDAIDRAIAERMGERMAFDPLASDSLLLAALMVSVSTDQVLFTEQEQQYLETNGEKLTDGSYSLKDGVRNQFLRRMQLEGGLNGLRMKFISSWEDMDPAQRMFGRVLRREAYQLRDLGVEELNTLFRIRFWVDGLGYELPDGETIRGALNRLAMIARFERQTANFRGREEELAVLNAYVQRSNLGGNVDMMARPPLLIYGVGGIGKSTLVSRFILDRVLNEEGETLPFVYLDFDHVGLSISDPLALLAVGLKQLSAQFPEASDGPAPISAALSNLLAIQERRKASTSGPARKGGSVQSFERVVGQLAEVHLTTTNAFFSKFDLETPVLVVLDSFEEAQYRTGETEIRSFLQALNTLNGYLPNLRLMIVGRSDLVVSPFRFSKLEVGDFDEYAARGYLKGVGVSDDALRGIIFEQVGGNPLTLKLAASLAEKERVGDKITLPSFKRLLAGTQVQELLVRRNIDHIRDPDVRSLALPGMLLRRIDLGVVQQILAPVCGLGEIDTAKAKELYDGLQRVTFLVEQRNGELHFRRDLRIALREAIWRKEGERCAVLHRTAVEYYDGKVGLANDAERLYHLLQRDGKASAEIEGLDWNALRPYLEDALLELPPTAAAFLARQFGVTLPKNILEQASQRENDFAMVRRMETVVLDGQGDVSQLEQIWREVEDRTDSDEPMFIFYRQLIALRLGLLDRMLDDLPARAVGRLELLYDYLKILRSNYGLKYAEGIRSLSKAIDYPANLLLSIAVNHFKLHALADIPLNEKQVDLFCTYLSTLDVNYDEIQFVQGNIWQPVHEQIDVALRKKDQGHRMVSLRLHLREIYQIFQGARLFYPGLLQRLMSVEADQFGLVLENETGKLVEDIFLPGYPHIVNQDRLDFLLIYFGGVQKVVTFIERVEEEKITWPPVSSSSTGPSRASRTNWMTSIGDSIKEKLGYVWTVMGSVLGKNNRSVERKGDVIKPDIIKEKREGPPSLVFESQLAVVKRAEVLVESGKLLGATDYLLTWATNLKREKLRNQILRIRQVVVDRENEYLKGTFTGDEYRRTQEKLQLQLLELLMALRNEVS